MKAVILAAGEGIRMRPYTINKPKQLLKICGKPILERIIDILPKDINELIIVVGYLEDQIKKYFGNSWKGRKIKYILQKEKKGTAHALFKCKPYLKGKFLFLYGDDLHSEKTIKECLKEDICLVVKKVVSPERFGVVLLNKDGSIKETIEKPEKPPSNLVSTGPMILDDRIFKYKAKKHQSGEYYLTDCISQMVKEHKVSVIKTDFWIPIGYPEDIKKAEKVLKYENNKFI